MALFQNRALMLLFLMLALMISSLFLPSMAHAAEGAAIDTAGIMTSIGGLAEPVKTVGTGILAIAALIFGFKLIKRFF